MKRSQIALSVGVLALLMLGTVPRRVSSVMYSSAAYCPDSTGHCNTVLCK